MSLPKYLPISAAAFLLSLAVFAGENLLDARLAAFRLGQRDHDALFGAADWQAFRRQAAEAIESRRR